MAETDREILEACRQRFGTPPRTFDPAETLGCSIGLSWLMRTLLFLSGDKLRTILRDQSLLRAQGRIVWGFLVQANDSLFRSDNQSTLPANVIYSPDTFFDDGVSSLLGLARGIFELKGTVPGDLHLKQFALAVSNETLRTMRLRVPPALSEGREVFFTTCLIHPPHLPGGWLADSHFPLVICPEKTDAVMVLPSAYWPDVLRSSWMEPG